MSILNNPNLSSQFSSFLSYAPDEFQISDCPALSIPSINSTLKYPLSPSTINALKIIASSSPFGHGTETKYDNNVRNSLEIPASMLNFIDNEQNVLFCDSRHSPMLDTVRQCLMSHIPYITAEPYKLLIYSRNCFFKSHVDTARSATHFGTLLLSLPNEQHFTGGEFELLFNDKKVEWVPEKQTADPKSDWIAFYSDIRHQIKPVLNGERIILTFNLLVPNELLLGATMVNNSIKNDRDLLKYDWSLDDSNISGMDFSSNQFFSQYCYQVFEALKFILKNDYLFVEFPAEVIWIMVEFNGELIVQLMNNILHGIQSESDIQSDVLCKFDCKRIVCPGKTRNGNAFDTCCKRCALSKKGGNEKSHDLDCNERNADDELLDGICIVFSHRYPANDTKHGLHPMLMKGSDYYLYRCLKQYFRLYASAMVVKSIVGLWSDEYASMEEAEAKDFDGRIMDEWKENDSRTEWQIVLGGEWWEVPSYLYENTSENSNVKNVNKNLRNGNSTDCDFHVLYTNKKQTLADAKFVNSGEDNYGNCGSYNLENQYFCTGLLLTARHEERVVEKAKKVGKVENSSERKRKMGSDLGLDSQPTKHRKINN